LTQRNRKFWGISIILAIIIGWAILAVWLYDTVFAGFGAAVQLVYFALAGMGWFFPAALLVRWMSRPDEV
jgi:Protein of unknown function (DUF2842)